MKTEPIPRTGTAFGSEVSASHSVQFTDFYFCIEDLVSRNENKDM